ncbi:MAG TPA: YHS domain-containing protein, partial [Thermoanaerobaculia bacterium]
MKVKDPVCGMTVEPQSAAARRVYGGRTFYFCAKGCAEAFDKDPKKYAAALPRQKEEAAARQAPP